MTGHERNVVSKEENRLRREVLSYWDYKSLGKKIFRADREGETFSKNRDVK